MAGLATGAFSAKRAGPALFSPRGFSFAVPLTISAEAGRFPRIGGARIVYRDAPPSATAIRERTAARASANVEDLVKIESRTSFLVLVRIGKLKELARLAEAWPLPWPRREGNLWLVE